MTLTPKNKADVANCICNENIYDIEGIKEIEYPIELNAFIIVMQSGKKYLVEVNDYNEED